MRAALRAILTGDSDIAAIVGERITWVERDQGGALPAIVLEQISHLPSYTMRGPDGLSMTRVQVDCWAMGDMGPDQAIAVANAVKRCVSGFRAVVGDADIRAIFVDGERDDAERHDGETYHRTMIDLIIHHRAA